MCKLYKQVQACYIFQQVHSPHYGHELWCDPWPLHNSMALLPGTEPGHLTTGSDHPLPSPWLCITGSRASYNIHNEYPNTLYGNEMGHCAWKHIIKSRWEVAGIHGPSPWPEPSKGLLKIVPAFLRSAESSVVILQMELRVHAVSNRIPVLC